MTTQDLLSKAALDFPVFRRVIIQELANNITEKASLALANILAIDYHTRLEANIAITDHLNTCLIKLKDWLGQKVIIDDSFSFTLTLFAIAISSNPINKHDKQDVLSQEQSQDAITNAVINSTFAHLEDDNTNNIKSIINSALSGGDDTVLDYVVSEPKSFISIMNGAISRYIIQKQIYAHVKTQIDIISRKTNIYHNRLLKLTQSNARCTAAVCALAMITLSVATSGTLAVMIIPATAALSTTLIPKIGEFAGKYFATNFDHQATSMRNNLEKTRCDLLNNPAQVVDLALNVGLENVATAADYSLAIQGHTNIIDTMQNNATINTEETIARAQHVNIAKSQPQQIQK